MLCKLKLFTYMPDAHKLQYVNNYDHWKILDSVLDLNYFSISNPNPNLTHFPKHWTLIIVFSVYFICRISLCACAHGVKSEILKTTCFGSSESVFPNLFWLAPPFLTNKFLSPPTMPSTHINTIFRAFHYKTQFIKALSFCLHITCIHVCWSHCFLWHLVTQS